MVPTCVIGNLKQVAEDGIDISSLVFSQCKLLRSLDESDSARKSDVEWDHLTHRAVPGESVSKVGGPTFPLRTFPSIL